MNFYTENSSNLIYRLSGFRRTQMSESHDETVRTPVGDEIETSDQTDNKKGKSIKVIHYQTL